MRRHAALALMLLAAAATCHAEPRWCSVAGNDMSNKLIYPPIARAARVSGVVLARMIYAPNGKVQNVEPISGPKLLSALLTRQTMDWTVKTDAVGDSLCEALIIVEFKLMDGTDHDQPPPPTPTAPSILRFSVTAEPIPIETSVSGLAQ